MLFVIPWGRHWIVGTTDTDWQLDKAHPAASSADIDYVLDHVNAVLAAPLTREDVEGVYAGLRPLLAGESEATSKLSREHVVAQPVPGLVVGRRRQVHDLPGDGQGRGRRGGAGLDGGCRRAAPTRCRCSVRRATTALWNARHRIAAAHRPARGRIEHLLAPLRLADRRGARRWPTATRRSAEPLPGADDYLRGRGRLRGHARGRPAPRRRARPAGPGSRSRPGTAA